MIRYLTVALLLPSLLFGGTQSDLFTISIPPFNLPTVENGYANFGTSPYGGGWDSYNPDGSPALPRVRLTYLLSPDADLKSVRIVYLDTVAKILDGNYDVMPALVRTCGCVAVGLTATTASVTVNPKDTSVYKANAWYPSARHTFTTGAMGMYRMVDVTFAPYVYNPVKRQLKRMVAGRIQVVFDRIPTEYTPHRLSDDERILFQLIDNDTAVLHEYGEFWPVGAEAHRPETPRYAGLLPVHEGAMSLPASHAGHANRITMRTLDGRVVFDGIVRGGSIRSSAVQGWKILHVTAVPLD